MSEISAASIIHRANEKEYITGYWQKRSTGFANLRKAELHSDKQLLWHQEITRHLPQNRKLKILDIGCGAGFFGILLGQKHRVTGIDLTPEMIEAARSLAAAERSNAEFMVMDAEALDFADASFDAVISRNVMWNLPHPETAYREWLRVLKPGGLLFKLRCRICPRPPQPEAACKKRPCGYCAGAFGRMPQYLPHAGHQRL